MVNTNLKKELLSLPNQLTFLRIICIPAVIYLMIINTPILDLIAAIIFFFASLTDFFDGWLARKKNLVSKLGILMDPLADKLLIVSVLLILIHQKKIDPIIPTILIWREFGILTLRSVASGHGMTIGASRLAKHKTLIQIIGILGIIVGKGNEFLGVNWFSFGYMLLLISVFVSVLSGYEYLKNYINEAYLKNSG